MTPSWLGLAGALLLLSVSLESRAEESRREIAARFSGPSGCGQKSVLARRFGDRVPELVMRFTDDAPVKFTIEKSGEVVRARLLILLEEGGELSRTIEADNCEAAVEAIAFVAAVALDPGAVDPLQLRAQDRLIPEKAVPRERERQRESKSESDREKPPEDPKLPESRAWTFGAYGRAQFGAGPEFLWGGGASLENSPERGGLWAPSARIAVGYVLRGGFEEEFGTARFQLATAGIDLCPSQLRLGIFRAQMCGALQGGILLAQGRDTFEPARSSRPWLGAGPSIYSEVMLAGPVGLSYRGAAIFPAVRDAFRFQETVFHEVPPVALELDAGFSVRF